ncbi:conserved hypothetical protein [Ricinus communis]|uniref:Uncharacterized protein n=1 Tax=Ricinus communis TaxID=3988 RepID=B9TKK0_RICCO|nr:conserved hypothetical protein [Ricinus communis]
MGGGEVGRPRAHAVARAQRVGVARVERHVQSRRGARLLQRPGVGVVGVDVQAGQHAGVVEGVVGRRFDAVVVGGADVLERRRCDAGHLHDLVVEFQLEERGFGADCAGLPAGAELGGLGQFRFQRIGRRLRIQLRVLHRAERGGVVGEHRQRRIQQVGYVQRWQGLGVVGVERRSGGNVFAGGRDLLVAHARRDAPLADGDAVVDVGGVRVGAVDEGGDRAIGAGRHCLDVVVVVAALAQVAVADRDVVRHAAGVEALRVARFDAQHFVVARLPGDLRPGGIDQRALAEAFVVVGLDFHFLRRRQGVPVADVHAVAVTTPEVGRPGVLERVGVVLRHGQAAGRAG